MGRRVRVSVIGLGLCFLAPSIFSQSKLDFRSELDKLKAPDRSIRAKILEKLPDPLSSQELLNPFLGHSDVISSSQSIGAFLAAVIVHTIHQWRETGSVDAESIGKLFDRTELYVGLSGAIAGRWVYGRGVWIQEKVVQAWRNRADALLKAEAAKPVGPSIRPAAMMLGSWIMELTRSAAFLAGMELFGEYYREATTAVPAASSMGRLLTDPDVQKHLILWGLVDLFRDPVRQKKVFETVFANRLVSLDFITLAIGVYAGAKAGAIVGSKVNPHWLVTAITSTIGAILGAGVQGVLVPYEWRQSAQIWAEERQINSHKGALAAIMDGVATRVEQGIYPARPFRAGLFEYSWFSGVDLETDLHKIETLRSSLLALYFKQYVEYVTAAIEQEQKGELQEPSQLIRDLSAEQYPVTELITLERNYYHQLLGLVLPYQPAYDIDLIPLHAFPGMTRTQEYYLDVITAHIDRTKKEYDFLQDLMAGPAYIRALLHNLRLD